MDSHVPTMVYAFLQIGYVMVTMIVGIGLMNTTVDQHPGLQHIQHHTPPEPQHQQLHLVMVSNAGTVTVLILSLYAMVTMIAGTGLMNITVDQHLGLQHHTLPDLQHPQHLAMVSDAGTTVGAFLLLGFVMDTMTAKMVRMNTIAILPVQCLHHQQPQDLSMILVPSKE